MHYYQFNIGDYVSSTQHLDENEDLAYRRMLDIYYSKESPLPEDQKEIARLIRMRTHSECIAIVLREFFVLGKDGYHCKRADKEILTFQAKSNSARRSAEARWNKNKDLELCQRNANALQAQCEGNAKHKTLNTKHKTNNKDICQQVADGWNSCFPSLPQVIKVSQKRKSHINASIGEFKKDFGFDDPENWKGLFEHASKSDFLMGRKTDWAMDFDFIINKSNLLKIIEGKYDNT